MITPIENLKEIEINGDRFKGFIKYFNFENYSIKEKRKFTETQDRLIEELERRKKGEYFTPTNWVDESIKIIDKNLGSKWREDYVVWDCACGTKNLTRDYSFENLYCSTLIETDLAVSINYNKKNVSFQYDFLNEDIALMDTNLSIKEIKEMGDSFGIPKELLKDLLLNKPFLFFINPPYGTANADGAKGDGVKKKGMSKTAVNEEMKKNSMGYASQQLYAQFIYKIMKIKETFNLTNVTLGIFAPSIYMSGTGFKKFRKVFLQQFKHADGMYFRASHFADVGDDWGISFSIWETGESVEKENFIHTVKEIENGEIIDIKEKNIYNTDFKESLSKWMQSDLLKKYKNRSNEYPQLSSALNVKPKGRGTFIPKSLGFINNLANNIYQSEGGVGIFSSAYSGGNGYSILPEYFDRVIVGFMARRIGFSLESWKNQKDEFFAPDEFHPKYHEFLEDSLILGVFNPKAKVSSLRNISYGDKNWNIKNEFFFMDIEEIKELAEKFNNEEIYDDTIEFSGNRYLFNRIEYEKLSEQGKKIYALSKDLVRKSFPFRETLNNEYPNYNLNTWDAGWFQIKFILENYFSEDYKIFTDEYKKLFNYWKEYIYEFGFLKE